MILARRTSNHGVDVEMPYLKRLEGEKSCKIETRNFPLATSFVTGSIHFEG